MQYKKKNRPQHQTYTLFSTEPATFTTTSFWRSGSIMVSYSDLLNHLHLLSHPMPFKNTHSVKYIFLSLQQIQLISLHEVSKTSLYLSLEAKLK